MEKCESWSVRLLAGGSYLFIVSSRCWRWFEICGQLSRQQPYDPRRKVHLSDMTPVYIYIYMALAGPLAVYHCLSRFVVRRTKYPNSTY